MKNIDSGFFLIFELSAPSPRLRMGFMFKFCNRYIFTFGDDSFFFDFIEVVLRAALTLGLMPPKYILSKI